MSRTRRSSLSSLSSHGVHRSPQLIAKRSYAIRDRYYFPLTEQEKMAIKLEEEKVEATRVKEDLRSAKRALKRELQFRAPRPTITMPGTIAFSVFFSCFALSALPLRL